VLAIRAPAPGRSRAGRGNQPIPPNIIISLFDDARSFVYASGRDEHSILAIIDRLKKQLGHVIDDSDHT
jgi:hypothetical protein